MSISLWLVHAAQPDGRAPYLSDDLIRGGGRDFALGVHESFEGTVNSPNACSKSLQAPAANGS